MSRITFKEASRLWMADKARHVKVTSLAAYSLMIRTHLEPRFYFLEDITPESVQKLVDDKLAAGVGATTVRGIIQLLKTIVRFCENKRWIGERRYEVYIPKRKVKPDPKVLPMDDEKRLLRCLVNDPKGSNIGLLICLCCGLRIGEVCALKWEDVDFQRGVIHIRRTVHRIYDPGASARMSALTIGLPKTGNSEREIPIPVFLARILDKEYSPSAPDSYILTRKTTPMDPQTFRYNFYKVTNNLGIPPRKVHSLRHTFATRCLESKCDVKTLSVLLGHSDVSTTLNLYVHPGLEQKRRCVEDMMKLL